MLDTATKRRIDTARDILVGKVPDPKSQVEQITIALIYKFMDDIDAESEELGGTRTFFAGAFARYGWAKLVRAGLGGHETLNLYAEAITTMPENPGIPPLFRNIFKNAFLPYRDPETLRAFLKVIDEFTYDHSERLGDAFEYLLSVLGAQGDAGQFRTPRHVIDFIVAVLDPQKDESVLDPACGTAGFLVSSYKHILKANTDAEGNSTLTPDDRGRLAANFRGYDISPDMVRLSLVNLYLHGFAAPHVFEYDTLTSEDRWHERADVILANPPFMSPKGGIRPHGRFSVKSKRSEVLFVDYMAEHLTPAGRAGIIVPEGIIFQSQKAHKQLRKLLVQDFLVAVVSLPAGVFQPYSGVKTSILILDRALAKRAAHVAFLKVEHDGYDLGAQRRPIERNDLPQAEAEVGEYLRRLRAGEAVAGFAPTLGRIVEKEKVAANDDYNLSGEQYRPETKRKSAFPLVAVADIAKVRMGETLIKGNLTGTGKPIYSADTSDEPWAYSEPTRLSFGRNTIVIGARGTIGSVKYPNLDEFTCTQTTIAITVNPRLVLAKFVYYWLRTFNFKEITEGVGIPMITVANVNRMRFPLPSIEVQEEILEEINGYQKVVNGARAVLENYRPHIPLNPDWPTVALGDVCEIKSGGTPNRSEGTYWNGDIPWIGSTVCKDSEVTTVDEYITETGLKNSAAKIFPPNSTLIALVGATIGKTGFLKFESATNQNIAGVYPKSPKLLEPAYLFYATQKLYPEFMKLGEGKFRMANLSFVRERKIPLPPFETQQTIVTGIKAEQALVKANEELVERMEGKIRAVTARVWDDEEMSE